MGYPAVLRLRGKPDWPSNGQRAAAARASLRRASWCLGRGVNGAIRAGQCVARKLRIQYPGAIYHVIPDGDVDLRLQPASPKK